MLIELWRKVLVTDYFSLEVRAGSEEAGPQAINLSVDPESSRSVDPPPAPRR